MILSWQDASVDVSAHVTVLSIQCTRTLYTLLSLQYPFDVNGVIVQLAAMCDLILVFLDPIGQALCSRSVPIDWSLVPAADGGHRRFINYIIIRSLPPMLVRALCAQDDERCEGAEREGVR